MLKPFVFFSSHAGSWHRAYQRGRPLLKFLWKGNCHSALASQVSFPQLAPHLSHSCGGHCVGDSDSLRATAPASDALRCLLQGLSNTERAYVWRWPQRNPWPKRILPTLQMDSPRRCFQSTFSYNKDIQNTPSSWVLPFTVSLSLFSPSCL